MTKAVALGILGPLFVAAASWSAAARVWKRAPERLTAMMIAAFAGKLVFFGAYVAIMLSALSLPAVPFVVSFTASFVVFHVAEAVALQRMFSGAGGVGRDTLS